MLNVLVLSCLGRGTWLDPKYDLDSKPQMLHALQFARPTCPSGLVVDVGANGGRETQAARKFGYEVLAVECLQSEFVALQERWKDDPDITLLYGCASDSLGVQTFHEASASSSLHKTAVSQGNELQSAQKRGFRQYNVMTFPMDALVDSRIRGASPPRRVCLVKIDTQGHEISVMHGMASTIMRHRPVVIFELDYRFGPQVNLTVPWMRSLGYDCAVPTPGKQFGLCSVCNVLCMPTASMWDGKDASEPPPRLDPSARWHYDKNAPDARNGGKRPERHTSARHGRILGERGDARGPPLQKAAAQRLLQEARHSSPKHTAHGKHKERPKDEHHPDKDKGKQGDAQPPLPTDVWDPQSAVQSQLGGLFELLRPPLPPLRRLVELTAPKRTVEIGAADGKMLMAMQLLLQSAARLSAEKVCGAGINSLAYKYGTDEVPKKALRGAEAIWFGVMHRSDFELVAREYRLPMPALTPNFVHTDVFSESGGVPFHSGAADLVFSQASLDKWRHYPLAFSGWNASVVMKRRFNNTEVAASTARIATDLGRILRTGGTAHVQITTTMNYNRTLLSSLIGWLPRPAFDGTMLPILMAIGTQATSTAESRQATRVNEFVSKHMELSLQPSGLHHVRGRKRHECLHRPAMRHDPYARPPPRAHAGVHCAGWLRRAASCGQGAVRYGAPLRDDGAQWQPAQRAGELARRQSSPLSHKKTGTRPCLAGSSGEVPHCKLHARGSVVDLSEPHALCA